MTPTILRHKARGLLIPLILVLAVPLMGMSMHEAENTIDDAKATVAAAEPNVTRWGRYQFYEARAAVTAAQAEFDAMDYDNAECYARKAMKLAQKSTTMQSFTD